jgi:hypothetical protein
MMRSTQVHSASFSVHLDHYFRQGRLKSLQFQLEPMELRSGLVLRPINLQVVPNRLIKALRIMVHLLHLYFIEVVTIGSQLQCFREYQFLRTV